MLESTTAVPDPLGKYLGVQLTPRDRPQHAKSAHAQTLGSTLPPDGCGYRWGILAARTPTTIAANRKR
jgi:hypothetical protein